MEEGVLVIHLSIQSINLFVMLTQDVSHARELLAEKRALLPEPHFRSISAQRFAVPMEGHLRRIRRERLSPGGRSSCRKRYGREKPLAPPFPWPLQWWGWPL